MEINNITYTFAGLSEDNYTTFLTNRIYNNIDAHRNSLVLMRITDKTTNPTYEMSVLYYDNELGYMSPVNSLVDTASNTNKFSNFVISNASVHQYGPKEEVIEFHEGRI